MRRSQLLSKTETNGGTLLLELAFINLFLISINRLSRLYDYIIVNCIIIILLFYIGFLSLYLFFLEKT